MIGIKEKIGP